MTSRMLTIFGAGIWVLASGCAANQQDATELPSVAYGREQPYSQAEADALLVSEYQSLAGTRFFGAEGTFCCSLLGAQNSVFLLVLEELQRRHPNQINDYALFVVAQGADFEVLIVPRYQAQHQSNLAGLWVPDPVNRLPSYRAVVSLDSTAIVRSFERFE